MRGLCILFTILMMVGTAFGQYAQGPATGSIAGGAATTTDNFLPGDFSGPLAERVHNKIQYPPLPPPPDVPPPTGPEGSNYMEDPVAAKLMSVNSVPPVTVASFPGIPQTSSIPPDCYMAVGPNHVMAVVNTSFRIADKEGNTLKTINATSWFNNVFPSSGAFDPKVLYDQYANRWVMVWLQQDDGTQTSNYLVSVSDDDNPIGVWYNWALPANVNGSTPSGNWSDYQGVGYDSLAIYITSNQFQFGGGGQYVKFRIVGKAQLYANTAGPVTWTDFWDLRDQNGQGTWGTRPTRAFGTHNDYYLVSTSPFTTGTYFCLHRVTDPLGSPTFGSVNVSVVQWTNAPNASQLGGGSMAIEAGGSALRNEPVYKNNSIWAVHSVRSPSGYSSIRYLRFNTTTNTAVEDVSFGADGFWHFYNAIAVDKDDNLAITFSRSGLTEYIGAFMTWKLNSDPPGLRPSVSFQPGKANYVKDFGSGRNRWGDYMGIGLDPADQNNFWMFTEYAESPANTWGTWFYSARLVPFPGSRIYSDVSSHDFGLVEVGYQSDTIGVTLFNTGDNTLIISSIAKDQPAYALIDLPPLPANIATFDSVTFKVAFIPTAHGTVSDTIRIASNDATNPTAKITLRGRGIVIGRSLPGVLYASSSEVGNSQLYFINTTTGVAAQIGAEGVSSIQGLGIHPVTKELYGISSSPVSTQFYRMSSAHGDALSYKTVNIGNMKTFTFDSAGMVYGGTTTGRLYRIDLQTSDTTYIGTASGIVYSGLSFNPISGDLWASVSPPIAGKDKIYKVNTTTGEATLVGNSGGGATPYLAFDPNGVLYALKGVAAQVDTLIVIDTTTGTGIRIGSTGVAGLLAIATRTDSLATAVEEPLNGELPRTFVLNQNYPNPFNPTTRISYGLPRQSQVRLTIYNVLGQLVDVLFEGTQEAGFHELLWNSTGGGGGSLASGIYFYKLEASGPDGKVFTDSKKMLLIK